MRIVATSDTHGALPRSVPKGDIFVHCGDFSMYGNKAETLQFFDWMRRLDFKHKILVPGNHDSYLEPFVNRSILSKSTDVHILVCEGIEIEGVRFFGFSYTPRFGNFSFMLNSEELNREVRKIPLETEVLITHGPPHAILDTTWSGASVGDPELRTRTEEMPYLKLHLFGHIHEAKGVQGIHYNISYTDKQEFKVFEV